MSEIEILADQPDSSKLDISNLEISIFTGFFLARKLIEAKTKLSPKTAKQNVNCQTAPKKPDAPNVDLMNRFDTDDLYQLDEFSKSQRSLNRTCNLFIHSVFLWMVYKCEGMPEGEGTVSGVYLTSSYDKEKLVYWFKIEEILRVFKSIVEDENNMLSMHRDPETNEWVVIHKQ